MLLCLVFRHVCLTVVILLSNYKEVLIVPAASNPYLDIFEHQYSRLSSKVHGGGQCQILDSSAPLSRTEPQETLWLVPVTSF